VGTDQPTHERTKSLIEALCSRLKTLYQIYINMVLLDSGEDLLEDSGHLLLVFVQEDPEFAVERDRNFPCQTLKISKVSLVVMGS
jgi:hypothetical protein